MRRSIGLGRFLAVISGCVTPIADPGVEDTRALGGTLTGATRSAVRLLALGDSYTIGEAVDPADRWPNQLAALLESVGYPVTGPQIIARTGWTTGELLGGIAAGQPEGPFDLVTLQIGVNNQYGGLDVESYRVEFGILLKRAIDLAGGRPGRVLVLSIPDWGVTPFAIGRNRATIAAEIDDYNQIIRQEAERAGSVYVDVTPLSRAAAHDSTLIADDGLHPSGEMYRRWARLALPAVREALGDEAKDE